MPSIDASTLKSWLSDPKHQHPSPSFRSSDLRRRSLQPVDRRPAGKLMEGFFRKAGLDLDQLNKLLRQSKSEARRAVETEQAELAKHRAGLEAAFRQDQAARRAALQLLNKPFTSTYVSLDKAFLIWEMPHPNLDWFVDSHTESFNNWAKVLLKADRGNDTTQFIFYFIWTNESSYAAVVNVSTALVLNGIAEAAAAPGFFSGDNCSVSLSADLSILRWSGWGNDPTTGQSLDQTPVPYGQSTQYQPVAYLPDYGGTWFDLPSTFPAQTFAFEPFDLSYSLLAIPAEATTLFEVSLQISYWFQDGGNIGDNVTVDLAYDPLGHIVLCPSVTLEVLTPQAAVR